MSEHKNHPFHLVNPSPWPLVASFSVFAFVMGLVAYMHDWHYAMFKLIFGFILILAVMFWWWSDVIYEAKVDHAHNLQVRHGLKWGMMMFILSETMFFAAFFAAFFYLWLSPVNFFEDIWTARQGVWPPEGINALNPWDLPLLNTLILLLSGTTVTWAHHAIKEGKTKDVTYGLLLTVVLGLVFSCIQFYEYHHAGFGLREEGFKSFYATLFYMLTGFHGLHVIIGTIFLAVCLIRNLNGSFSKTNHLGLDFAAWYWHFVDVVWIFLFVFLYILAGK